MNKVVILTIIGIVSVGLGMILAQKIIQSQTTVQDGAVQPAVQEVPQHGSGSSSVASCGPNTNCGPKTAGQPVQVGNKICPVSGRPIGIMGPGVEETYNGKVYHLCCGGCISTFESDPGKYSKIADDEVRAGN